MSSFSETADANITGSAPRASVQVVNKSAPLCVLVCVWEAGLNSTVCDTEHDYVK